MRRIFSLFTLFLALNVFGQIQKKELILDLRSVSNDVYTFDNLIVENNNEGLELTIKKGEEASVVFSAKDKYWDLRDWIFLSIEVENLTNNTVRFDPIVLYDNPRREKKAGKKVRPSKTARHIAYVGSKENLVYNCVITRDQITASDYPQLKDFPGMKGLPNGIIMIWEGVDAKHIKGLKLKFPAQEFDRKLLVKQIVKKRSALPDLYVANRDAYFPFINEYGQYKHENWEGKITDDSQFAEAIIREEKDLAAHTGSVEWNRFGGYVNGPRYESTGNFRTQKVDGKWWIIDPDGYLFWSTGVNGAGKLTVSTPINGREHFFEGIPKRNEAAKDLFQGKYFKHGLNNLYKKYGENSEDKYVDVSLKRMKSWGLNTLGGWSTENVAEKKEDIKLPYTVYINSVAPEINEKFPDVFDPKWAEDLEKKVKAKAEFVKDDPYFFGFFINNEIHWGNPQTLAAHTLSKGAKCAGKKEYINLLKKELKTIEKFNSLTGASFKSWNALLKTKVHKNGVKHQGIREINISHYKNMTEQYFKISSDLIHKYAPGKMYLGCRWHGNHKNNINVAIAAKYLDILTFNAYENEIEFYPYPPKNVDKPFIVSEFNFGALDRGKFFTGLGYASDQRNRGEKYQNFINGALRNPKCVGAHWFMWANSTTAGRGNGENANCGLVSMTDQIYYELISYMREINYKMYNYRLDK